MSHHSPTLRPIVFEPCPIHHLLRFCMNHSAPSNQLIICSSRDDFLHDILNELPREPQDHQRSSSALDLLAPTLHNLLTARNINLAFCPDLANLHVYLSAILHKPGHIQPEASGESDPARSLLVVVNPIRLHEPTSSFSVQGFNRTFAAAVETAHHLGQQLIIVECAGSGNHLDAEEDEEISGQDDPDSNPWDQGVSMLNVTTKTFGAGERGWVGRTIKIRQVAERWCNFVKLDDHGMDP